MGFLDRIKRVFGFGSRPYGMTVEPIKDDGRVFVVLRIPFESGENFGTEAELDAMYALEEEMDAAMPDHAIAEVDGNEVGGGEFLIFTLGPDAEVLKRIIRETLGDRPMPKGTAICGWNPDEGRTVECPP